MTYMLSALAPSASMIYTSSSSTRPVLVVTVGASGSTSKSYKKVASMPSWYHEAEELAEAVEVALTGLAVTDVEDEFLTREEDGDTP